MFMNNAQGYRKKLKKNTVEGEGKVTPKQAYVALRSPGV
jgi:hypothetical protein